ncbi:unnamed protein product, partial [Mycena citricolor]
GVPGVAGVAVGRGRRRVSPAPVGVEDDRILRRSAASARCALLSGESRVYFRLQGADLLRLRHSSETESEESSGREHCNFEDLEAAVPILSPNVL